MISSRNLIIALWAISIVSSCALAKPYFFFQDAQTDEKKPEAANLGAISSDNSKLEGQLHQRIHSHLNELYSHGSSAVRQAVGQVQPDISNIGKDLNDVLSKTRDDMERRIAPLAQTVRPYLDHAQKAVAPYVSQAKEEVPKLISQAGPVLTKVGGQVRDGVTGLWDKLKPGQEASAKDQIVEGAEEVQRSATDGAKQAAESVKAQAEKVADKVSEKTSA